MQSPPDLIGYGGLSGLRLYRRRQKGLPPDALQRKEGGMVPGGKVLQPVQGVDLAVLSADAVLDVGGQVVKIFLSP